MKHLFIVNPTAGKGKTTKLIPEINQYFEGSKEDFTICITQYPGHAIEIAREYSKMEDYRIYSVGGDGTLNEVLNGMALSGSSLGVIPSGSGNDFVKSINVSSDIKGVISSTIEGSTKLIDMAKINTGYFVNIASLGFDAQVAYHTQQLKMLPLVSGKMAYILGIFRALLQCKSHLLEIVIDDVTLKFDTLLIAIGNGRYYGGGMLALPDAKIDDGMFDICLAEKMSRIKILHLFPKFMKGQHATIKGVHFYSGKKVQIRSASPIAMNSDGEITIVNEAAFEILPKALSFIFPRQ